MSCQPCTPLDRLQQVTERFSGLMSVIPGGVLFVNETGIIEEANDRICEVTGYEAWELHGMSLDMLTPAGKMSLSVILRDFLRNLSSSQRYMESLIRRKDGTTLTVRLSRYIFQDACGSTYIDLFYPAENTQALPRA